MQELKDVITEEAEKYTVLWEQYHKRLLAWKDKRSEIKKIFDEVVTDTKREFKNKPVNFRDIFASDSNGETVQLQFGQMIAGKKINNDAPNMEDGACLVFSQVPTGEIYCTVYPCVSENMRPFEGLILYKRFKSPEDITYEKVLDAVKFLFIYQRQTSAAMGIGFWSWDKWVYHWHNWTAKIMFVFLPKLIKKLIKFPLTDDNNA